MVWATGWERRLTNDAHQKAGSPEGQQTSVAGWRLWLSRLGSLRHRSLAGGLVLVAAVWTLLALVTAGVAFSTVYRLWTEQAFDGQLSLFAHSIIGEMTPSDGGPIQAPTSLNAPFFELPLSGWYWTISERTNPDPSTQDARTGPKPGERVIFASRSLVGDPLLLPPPPPDPRVGAYAPAPGGGEVRVVQRLVTYGGREYNVAVAGDAAALHRQVWRFNQLVIITLTLAGCVLIGAIFLQVRIGLRPLKRMEASLADVRYGRAERLDENLPRELAPVAVELNALIASNREVVERARTHVGNLAHGLKTPLSVLANEARATESPLADKVEEQVDIMRTQIDHHLQRARMAAQRRVIGVSTPVAPTLQRLLRAMERIHADRGIRLTSHLAEDLQFRGEQQDLEEMAGNLVDNACKWARQSVHVTAASIATQNPSARDMFELVIEDDGEGLSEEQRRQAVKRGQRLDETVPGTGLGLSIVADLASLYGGELTLDSSPSGGLRAKVTLPTV